MEPQRWQQIKNILDIALDLPPAERDELIQDRCTDDEELYREVVSLLEENDTQNALMDRPVISLRDLAEPSLEGHMLGPYELRQVIGRGGMGNVYLAVRADDTYQRQVAVKVIRRGLDTDEIVRRFQNERQILANLEHPNIARLYDGGSTEDGRPFLVMEHIQGEPIDRYCDSRRLSIRERLELACKVCAAVHVAHQNLVVHRDLKPSNILVTPECEPKLLDFGIAKLLEPGQQAITRTADGARPLTPEYASPEQVRGAAVTTASDVYSLGVLLYELLTGHRPYHLDTAAPAEIERVICTQEPSRPSTVVTRTLEHRHGDGSTTTLTPQVVSQSRESDPTTLRRRLAGDVDAVVLKAMRKEPEQRYVSAAQLAADIRRHLEGQPVSARKGTTTYLAGKFVRRHRWWLAVGATLLALGTGLGITEIQRQRAVKEQLTASNNSRQLGDFLQTVLEGAHPNNRKGEQRTLLDILETTDEQIAELAGQPLLQAALLGTIGNVYRNIGKRAEASERLEQSLAKRREILPEDHPDIAISLLNLGLVTQKSDPKHTAALAVEAMRILERQPVLDQLEYAKALSLLGGVAATTNRFKQAILFHQLALNAKRKASASEPADIATSLNNLGEPLFITGHYHDAEETFEEALKIRKQELGELNLETANSLNNLGAALRDSGDLAAAEPLLRHCLEIRSKLEADPAKIASAHNNLGLCLQLQGRFPEAEAEYRQALQDYGGKHPDPERNLASLLTMEGRLVEAEQLAQEAVEQLREKDVLRNRQLAEAESILGGVLLAQGRLDEAEPLLRRSYQQLRDWLSDRPRVTREARQRLEQLEQVRAAGRSES